MVVRAYFDSPLYLAGHYLHCLHFEIFCDEIFNLRRKSAKKLILYVEEAKKLNNIYEIKGI